MRLRSHSLPGVHSLMARDVAGVTHRCQTCGSWRCGFGAEPCLGSRPDATSTREVRAPAELDRCKKTTCRPPLLVAEVTLDPHDDPTCDATATGAPAQTPLPSPPLMPPPSPPPAELEVVSPKPAKSELTGFIGTKGLEWIGRLFGGAIESMRQCARVLRMDEGALVWTVVLSTRCVESHMPVGDHAELLLLAVSLLACKLHFDESVPLSEVAALAGVPFTYLREAEVYVFDWLMEKSSVFVTEWQCAGLRPPPPSTQPAPPHPTHFSIRRVNQI